MGRIVCSPNINGVQDMFESLLLNGRAKKVELARSVLNVRPLVASHVTVTAAEGKIYAVGGLTAALASSNAFHCFDPATGNWTTLAPITTLRRSAGLAYYNGNIYLYGGYDHAGAITYSWVDRYNIASNTWTTGLTAGLARQDFASIAVGDRLYCFGGYNTDYISSNAYYVMGSDTWVNIASQPGLRYAGCATDGVNIYLVGGQIASGMLNTVYRYNIASNTFTTLAVLPAAGHSCALMLVDGFLICYSGYNNTAYSSAIYTMDLAEGVWKTVVDTGPVQGIEGYAQLGKSLYLVGGFDGSARVASTNKLTATTT